MPRRLKKWGVKRLREMWKDTYYRKLITLGIIIFAYMLFGTVFYRTMEGWSFVDAFYFTGMTVTTIGYGDFVPSHAISKLFTILYAFLGIGTFFYGITVIGKHYFEQEEERLARVFGRVLGLDQKTEEKIAEELHGKLKKL